MRYGIFSDVHSNLEALEAVLESIEKDRVDTLLCAGDLIGYGADPASCLKRIREKVTHAVCGNHDGAVTGRLGLDWFNDQARTAVEWTVEKLTPPDRQFLADLPYIWKDDQVTLVHGSLEEPEQFHYIFDLAGAQRCLELQGTLVTFIGHTHLPGVFIRDNSKVSFSRTGEIQLNPQLKYLVNVGSVGQPRDGDPRAAYCLYDSKTQRIQIRRVEYPVAQVQEKIRQAGLPKFLADRLAFGY